MTQMDKLERLVAELKRRIEKYDSSGLDIERHFAVECEDILEYIDSLQEEPVKDRFAFKAIPRLLDMIEPTDRAKSYVTKLADAFDAEGYHTDAEIVRESLKIMNGENVAMATMDEEPVSEKKCMFTNNNYTDEDRKVLCEDCKEKCEYNKKEESVSEDSKKHISLVTERMLKEGPIPTLRGKEKADFENEFNRFKQITGMINWPSKEEIYKNVILWFIVWSRDHLKIGDIVDKSEIDKQPVSEDLEKAANEWDAKASFTPFYMALDNNGNPYEIKQDYTTHAESFKAGAKWQKEKEYTCYEEAFEDGAKWKVENLWKPADGDDLPEIDREVIALLDNGKVGFAHRPDPKGWDGKSITTGEVEHYTPKTYSKGGWNIPDVKWWLDCSLPNMEED